MAAGVAPGPREQRAAGEDQGGRAERARAEILEEERAREEREAEETARKLSGPPVEPPAAPKDSAKRP